MPLPRHAPESATHATRLKIAFMAAPYAAVLWGLYWLHSAWWAVLLYHASIALYLGITRPPDLRKRLWRGWRPRSGTGLSLLCASAGPAFLVLWPVVADEPAALGSTLAAYGLGQLSWWLFVLYYVTVHPVVEELFWRNEQMPSSGGALLGDLAFAGYHLLVLNLFIRLEWAIIAVAVLVCAAWVWRHLAVRHDGLAVPLVSHAAAGVGIMAAASLLRL